MTNAQPSDGANSNDSLVVANRPSHHITKKTL